MRVLRIHSRTQATCVHCKTIEWNSSPSFHFMQFCVGACWVELQSFDILSSERKGIVGPFKRAKQSQPFLLSCCGSVRTEPGDGKQQKKRPNMID
ncbi:unnamed protein product [Pleuronectes platessa]|uniref:Uncharacterized protein n=1 Tax=Pleuronectes platessa TaxID=8262 RepID=A0A9N7VIX2_PLEPL|nr:unnamed protein product [Pleuronectes platessa]